GKTEFTSIIIFIGLIIFIIFASQYFSDFFIFNEYDNIQNNHYQDLWEAQNLFEKIGKAIKMFFRPGS
ncbi:MAG: hypothetical protein ACOCXD_02965, partial [Bacteroidota bacterium]